MNTSAQPLARISPAPIRRGISNALLFGLAVTLLYLGLVTPPEPFLARIPVLLLGGFTLWLANQGYKSREVGIDLWPDAVRDSNGRLLAEIDQIGSVDRGAFAFKPSNGFVLHLKRAAPLGWTPGLFWRVGTRIGVGGTTNPSETRNMADQIGFLLSEHP